MTHFECVEISSLTEKLISWKIITRKLFDLGSLVRFQLPSSESTYALRQRIVEIHSS